MRIGTYWLVRVGIVILLTGFVFLANFAYQNYFGQLPAAGKVALLYFAAGSLLAFGFILERASEKVLGFARVLIGGGLAAVYYVTYSAHYVERLKIVDSPVVAGFLLFSWAVLMIVLAEKRRSQSLAIFAILLCAYTAAINPISVFTLFSNFILTAAAVLFLVRNRWAAASSACLAATYLSYAYWKFAPEFFGHTLSLHRGDFWTGNLFLAGYWLIFTAAVLLSRSPEQTAARHPTRFLTANNAALFALVSVTLPELQPHSFWKFCFVFAGVLSLPALLARFLRAREIAAAYMTQSLLACALGITVWIFKYVAPAHQFMAFEACGLAVLCLGLASGYRAVTALSAPFTLAGLSVFWFSDPQFNWTAMPANAGIFRGADLLPCLLPLAQQRLARRFAEWIPSRLHQLVIIAGAATVFRWMCLWIDSSFAGFHMTAAWSVLAFILFAAGLGFRERVYRVLGLSLLGAALVRIAVIDVWELGTVERILSLLVLGAILVGMGFIYTNFQDRMRRWL